MKCYDWNGTKLERFDVIAVFVSAHVRWDILNVIISLTVGIEILNLTKISGDRTKSLISR